MKIVKDFLEDDVDNVNEYQRDLGTSSDEDAMPVEILNADEQEMEEEKVDEAINMDEIERVSQNESDSESEEEPMALEPIVIIIQENQNA